MPIEAALWSLLLLLSPGLGPRLWASLRRRYEQLPGEVEAWAPWIQSLGIPYLALILGSVSDRRLGLVGASPEAWLAGGLACALALSGAWFALGRTPAQPDPESEFAPVLMEEARWGFYRGAAAYWLRGFFSPLLGFGLAALEMGLTHALEHGRQLPPPATWKALLRAAFSTALFMATGNFWLTAGSQLLLFALLERQAAKKEASPIH